MTQTFIGDPPTQDTRMIRRDALASVRSRRMVAICVDFVFVGVLTTLIWIGLGVVTLGVAWFFLPSIWPLVAFLYNGVTVSGPNMATPGMRMFDLDLRMRDFDAMGLDVQVISPAPGQCYYNVPADIGTKAARAINEGIAAIAASRSDRIPAAMGSVALQAGGKAAAAEVEYCVKTLGLKGVEILAHVGDKELSDPDFEPFWATVESLGAVVFIHPNGYPQPQRFREHYFSNVIGNPLDTTMALHWLIFDGVLERYPNLKIIASHGGGYLPGYSGRIDHAWGARSDSRGVLPRPPSHYLKKIYLDTIVFTTHQLEAMVKVFGVDKILLGTDYPYDMGEYDPIGHIASCEALSPSDVAAIAGGNAKRLFGL